MRKKTLYLAVIILTFLIIGTISLPHFQPSSESTQDVAAARIAALTWLTSNFTPQTGLFTYALNPETAEFSLEDNSIRQLMSSRALAQESHAFNDILELHTKNLNFIMENWYQESENAGYILFNEKSKLGANAMLLRTLLASPLYEEYEAQANAVAQGILELQQDDGSFRAWYVEPEYKYDESYLLTFYSGEALLALIEYYEKTQDEKYLEAITLSAEHYIGEYVHRLKENYYPAYVPWHTIALNKLYKITADVQYAEAVFTMTDKLLELQDTETVVGRFYNPETPQYGRPHAASDAVYTEGLAYAYELASLTKNERSERYKAALDIGIANLISLQYKKETDVSPLPPYTYVGGLRTNLVDPFIRVDNTQHALDAFTKYLSLKP